MKAKKIKTITHEIGNVKILISDKFATIKNSYMSISFNIGTQLYFNYSEMVRLAKSGAEEEKEQHSKVLKLLTDVLVSCLIYHGETDFIKTVQGLFEEKLKENKDNPEVKN